MILAPGSGLAELGPLAARTALALLLIAAAVWIAARLLRPRLAARRRGARLRVIERIALEPRRSLHLVEVDGETLLVGAAEGGITFHRLDPPPRRDAAPGEAP